MRRVLVLVLAVPACGRLGFVDEPALTAPTHVPGSVTLGGTGTLELGSSEIDTTALTINGGPPAHGQLVAVQQVGAGSELALLQADHVTIGAGATVRQART